MLNVKCGGLKFKVDGGKADIENGFLSTNDSDIEMRGHIHLGEEQLKMQIRTSPKDPSWGALRAPIDINGAFKDPHVSLNEETIAWKALAAVFLGFIHPAAPLAVLTETGSEAKQSCDDVASITKEVKNFKIAASQK
jgi:hypothetical protein